MTEQQTLDREKKIAEIRERLEKATPGPWKSLDSCKGILWKYVQTNNGVITDNIRWQDAELIANAPEWLGFLLTELEQAEEQNRKLREDLEGKPWREFLKQVELEEKLQSAQQEIEQWKRLAKAAKDDIERFRYEMCEAQSAKQREQKLIEGLLQVYEECRDIECRKLVADILTSAGVNPDE